MIIVTRDSDDAILEISSGAAPSAAIGTTVRDIPDWDWSLASIEGVDRSQPGWLTTQLMWNGSTIVKRP